MTYIKTSPAARAFSPSRRAGFIAVLSLATLSLAASCASYDAHDAASALDDALLAAVRDDGDVRHAAMWVDAPRHGIDHGFAHGVADAESARAMTVDTPFFAASTGKLFVAAAILSFVDEGALSLDDAVSERVPLASFAGLPVTGGDDALARVTIRQLLAHRSGLPDYFSGTSHDGAPNVFALLVDNPARVWTRDDLFAYTRAHFAPIGAPGERFHYADTNYDLLGLVLEVLGGAPFHQVVRARVVDPLGLRHTWYHAFESPPDDTPPLADVFVDDANLKGAAALSADQAGGGLATTAGDLRLFVRALARKDAEKGSVLDRLATEFTDDAMHAGIDVGLCAWRIRPGGIFFALGGLPVLVGHSGATGVWAYYVPEHDAVLTGAVSQARWQEKHIEFLLSEVLPVLARTSLVDER